MPTERKAEAAARKAESRRFEETASQIHSRREIEAILISNGWRCTMAVGSSEFFVTLWNHPASGLSLRLLAGREPQMTDDAEFQMTDEAAAALLDQMDQDLEDIARRREQIDAVSARIDATLADIRGSGR